MFLSNTNEFGEHYSNNRYNNNNNNINNNNNNNNNSNNNNNKNSVHGIKIFDHVNSSLWFVVANLFRESFIIHSVQMV